MSRKMSGQEQNGGIFTLGKQYKLKDSIITLIRSTSKQISVKINSVGWTMRNRSKDVQHKYITFAEGLSIVSEQRHTYCRISPLLCLGEKDVAL